MRVIRKAWDSLPVVLQGMLCCIGMLAFALFVFPPIFWLFEQWNRYWR